MKNINEIFSDRFYLKLESMFVSTLSDQLDTKLHSNLRHKINIGIDSQLWSTFRIPLYTQLYKQINNK